MSFQNFDYLILKSKPTQAQTQYTLIMTCIRRLIIEIEIFLAALSSRQSSFSVTRSNAMQAMPAA